MNNKDIASTYNEFAVRGASPAAIIGMIYEVAIKELNRAIRAIDEKKIDDRVKATNQFFRAITELRTGLDYERGGDVARRLGRFYQIARGEILDASIRVDRSLYEKHLRLFSEMREAWRTVEKETAGAPAAPESAPVRKVTAPPPPDPEPGGFSWSA
ncbi:MAG TPA: flagellar export chaperone FliS [Candidatus Aquilonibacter sp.]|nr:flagellar export chaperone FliS [Candidatus Aquilonibacter sp.]